MVRQGGSMQSPAVARSAYAWLRRLTMTVVVMAIAPTEEPRTRDIHGQADASNRTCLGEVDRDRRADTAD
jgi:hypothetical protein